MRLTNLLRPSLRTRRETSSPHQLVVGLRNPGAEYAGTRHNLGFEVVDRLVERAGADFSRAPARIRGIETLITAGFSSARVLVPTTYMNESGASVRSYLDYYKVDLSNLLIVHDDIDLPFGRLRLQVGGGSGGHNGVRSVERSLGTNEFSRLKAGVGRPPRSLDPAEFVLRRFSAREREEVDVLLEDACDVVELWLSDRTAARESAAHRGRGD